MEKEIIRKWRCCMCPQRNKDISICPAEPGKTEETVCGFVITWIDEKGWKYKVVQKDAGVFQCCCQKENQNSASDWNIIQQMEEYESFDEAQEALNCLADKMGYSPMIKGSWCREPWEEVYKRLDVLRNV